MPSRREAILDATREAMRLHRDLDLRSKAEPLGRVDVFQAIVDLGVPLLFKPLTSLLGAYLPQPSPGILVTTQRSLAIQRFTAAHELGHHVLKHSASLDDESLLTRSPYGNSSYGTTEIAADVFAAEFLIPKWLLLAHLVRQAWSADVMAKPEVVYQLALRLGVSFTATCRALQRHHLIGDSTYASHMSVQPKAIKQLLLGRHTIESWYADVWLLGPKDQGTILEGRPGDVFIVRLRENAGSGYLWDFEEFERNGFAVVSDRRVSSDPDTFGGSAERILAAQSESNTEHAGNVELRESRPWQSNSEVLSRFSFSYSLFSEKGMPRAARPWLAAA